MEALADIFGKIVDLVGTIDFNGFEGGVEDHLAVPAFVHVLLDVGPNRGGDRVVDTFVEKGEKLSAGHFSFLASPGTFFLRK